MADKLFFLIATGDKDTLMEVALFYPLTVAKEKWMKDVKVILFGPSEDVVARDENVQKRIKRLQEEGGIEIKACKYCSDKLGISEKLEAMGITVEYVSPIMAQWIKDGWANLTF